jgi:aconitate hydratase
LIFADPADYDKISEGDQIIVENIRQQLKPGEQIKAELRTVNGSAKEIIFNHPLSARDIELILAGGRLNVK